MTINLSKLDQIYQIVKVEKHSDRSMGLLKILLLNGIYVTGN